MLKKVRKVHPNFAAGYNGQLDPTDLPVNGYSGKNWFSSKRKKGALEKSRVRARNLLALNGTQDDMIRYASAATLQYRGKPVWDAIDKVHFFAGNAYSSTEVSTMKVSPTKLAFYHGTPASARAKFGVYLHEEINATSLCFAVPIWQDMPYNSIRHRLEAKLYPLQAIGAAKPAAVLSGAIFTGDISGLSAPSRVVFTWTGTITLAPGEYSVEITDVSSSGADAGNNYTMVLSETALPNAFFGYAVVVTAAGTTYRGPSEAMLYEPVTTRKSARKVFDARINRNGNVSGVNPTFQGLAPREDVPALVLSDDHSFYGLWEGFLSSSRWDGCAWNTDKAEGSRWVGVTGTPERMAFKAMGRARALTTYKNLIAVCGIGGLAYFDLKAFEAVANDSPLTCIPLSLPRIDSGDHDWNNRASGGADVFHSDIRDIFTAGINPGRIFALYDDKIVWSGGITAATVGDYATFNAFATIQFGDTTDKLNKGAWYRGYILLWTLAGQLYYITGEPPIDPTYGYGTLRADYLGTTGICDLKETTPFGIFFTTDEGRQLWRIDGGLTPQRIDEGVIADLKVSDLHWDEANQELWVASERHAIRSYLTSPNDDGTLATQYATACSYVWDAGDGTWARIERPMDLTTATTEPAVVIHGATVWQAGWVDSSGKTYTLKSQSATDDGIVINPTTANLAKPENSDARAVTCNAELLTPEIDFTEDSGLMDAEGQITSVYFSGVLFVGDTATAYQVAQDGTETELGAITGAETFASPQTQNYHIGAGPVDRSAAVRVKLVIAGENKSQIRNLGWAADVYGMGALSS